MTVFSNLTNYEQSNVTFHGKTNSTNVFKRLPFTSHLSAVQKNLHLFEWLQLSVCCKHQPDWTAWSSVCRKHQPIQTAWSSFVEKHQPVRRTRTIFHHTTCIICLEGSGLDSVALPVTQVYFMQMSLDCVILNPEMESCTE